MLARLFRCLAGDGDVAAGSPNCLPPALPVPETRMAKFMTVGYGDEEGYSKTDRELRDAAHAHDARLKAHGARIWRAGSPVQVRNHASAGVTVDAGAFASAGLPVAGFAVIEADSLEEAIEMVSKTPCAVAFGVVEVWPLEDGG